MKAKPTLGCPFFRAFPSDSIPKATKGVNVYFFIQSSNSCKYTSEFREISAAATYFPNWFARGDSFFCEVVSISWNVSV